MTQYFAVFLILIAAAKGLAGQSCTLDDSVMNNSWVYQYDFRILHTDVIPDNTSLRLRCRDSNYNVHLWCHKGTMDKIPSTATCPKRLRASSNFKRTKCGSNNMNGEMYYINYDWPGAGRSFLYEVCYNRKDEVVLYSRHNAYGFNFVASKYVRPKFTCCPARAASFQASSVYNAFNTLLGVGQTYVKSPSDDVIQPGQLANPQDFVSYDQMDETFLYANAVPQFRGVKNGNWKAIEAWVHKLPTKDTYAVVTTGTYGILQLPHSQKTQRRVPMYLMPAQNKNPIPMWTYKWVKYNNRCYGFVTYNDDRNTNRWLTTKICRNTMCPSGLKFNNDPGKGVSHCCDCAHLEKATGFKYED